MSSQSRSMVSASTPGKRTRRTLCFSNKTGRSPNTASLRRSALTAVRSCNARPKSEDKTSRKPSVLREAPAAAASALKPEVSEAKGIAAARGLRAVTVGLSWKSMKEPGAAWEKAESLCIAWSSTGDTARYCRSPRGPRPS
ncbi:hypothetical protein FOQG_09578 [Fusarium oxysporum f. sp. raphani 54005]|uniref:Uncharacterized protein n=1 Tax=Fusarium oxysporum f. sp. raphani 54005 TaxID=1089458 RepID=X0CWC6_FUSOX|nr:hypothetical protein FOQG_09578 [Fusarium oxysporum f. sp. raphani 54005]EXK86765.1 hypothetical protein FOQG_09578 [Fusarium oxysporum f. sp. raphani 54005]EXK86766.1 hypothetical protein FOQG_09578 [Fusarium oxysporum f. sp. raphani 54005]EXK86767.1 hypothetical protein FOQG_09578 [Fusarium oxysporum f. sp. raphani 54005]EXK86768.1 hypothetical protein FOQG_09578 [Fusarium oxysporum f. sp. raphani 54005]